MNAGYPSIGQQRSHPTECMVGDWVCGSVVPHWSIHERLHDFHALGESRIAVPATVTDSHAPAPEHMLFEQSSKREESGKETLLWVRRR